MLPRANGSQRFEFLGDVAWLIEWSYDVRDFQVSGGPEWLGIPGKFVAGERAWPDADVFDVQATTGRPTSETEMKVMVRTLLAERFNLKLHRERRVLPVYALVVSKQGPKLVPSESSCRGEGCYTVGRGALISAGGTMDGLAAVLTNNVDRPVVDKTGLTGRYKFRLNFPAEGAGWRTGSAIFAPIRDLGLQLEPQAETVEMLVIDSAEQPSGN